MTDNTANETLAGRTARHVNWTRVEGIVGGGALLTSFLWFLGMPIGMAIGVGFGVLLLLDFVRALLFGASPADRQRPTTPPADPQADR